MSAFSLSLDQIVQDLSAIEAAGLDTALLAQLVKDSSNQAYASSSGDSDISDLIGRLAKLNPQELQNELSKVTVESNHTKEQLHETVYESGILFMKISEWMTKTKADFEGMLSTLQTIQSSHDSILHVATSNPSS